MAHSRSALKRWRQNEAHRARNRPVRTAARTAVKDARGAIASADPAEAKAAVRAAASILDRAAKHHVVHKNAVARQKSRLMRQLRKTVAAAEAPVAGPKRARKTAAKSTAEPKSAAKPRTSRTSAARPKDTAAKPKATRAKAKAKD